MTYSDHIESQQSLPQEKTVCSYCHYQEDQDHLYLHAATNDRLCQNCLAIYLEKDIEDSEDNRAEFEGFIFKRADYQFKNHKTLYDAYSDDGEWMTTPDDMAGILELVLMRKNYI